MFLIITIYFVDLQLVEYPRSDVSHQATRQQVLRREKKQIKHSNGKQAKKPAAITKSKRRKLERIKAPVTILRKRKQDEGVYHKLCLKDCICIPSYLGICQQFDITFEPWPGHCIVFLSKILYSHSASVPANLLLGVTL